MNTDKARRAVHALIFVVGLAGAAGCVNGDHREATGKTSSNVTNGEPDLGDPAVVRIEGDPAPCTGTLISGRVILTAAHCLESARSRVFFGADSEGAGDRVGLIAQAAHPAYDPIRLENDVALLLLERAVTVEPIAVSRMPIDAWIGTRVRVVGFGLTASGDPPKGEKRMGTARISALGDADLHCTADPSLPCVGDSGGPLFAGDQLIGVVSSGDPACSDQAHAMRADVYAQSFIFPQLAAWDASSVAGAGCAVSDWRSDGPWGAMLVLVAAIGFLGRFGAR